MAVFLIRASKRPYCWLNSRYVDTMPETYDVGAFFWPTHGAGSGSLRTVRCRASSWTEITDGSSM